MQDFEKTLQEKIDGKTKPLGALGRLESLAFQIACVQRTLSPSMARCQLIIFAADHGMALSGVSAYPQDVTRQMVLNFLSGGAAANVFADVMGIDLQVVDAGVAGETLFHPALISRPVAAGTGNAIIEPAMTTAQCQQALQVGREIGQQGDHEAVCFGEMGIGNTSSATLLIHKILDLPLAALTGRGTGLDEAGRSQKLALLEAASQRWPSSLSPIEALCEYGGFEIAMMAGAMMGASRAGKMVLVDGFIATAAALVAQKMEPEIKSCLVYAHLSDERGHKVVLDALQVKPLLDLNMRLGEGTGAVLAWPLLKAAAAMLNDMASFESANISEAL